MKRIAVSFLGILLLTVFTNAQQVAVSGEPAQSAQARIIHNYGKLPLSFELNQGQTDPAVKFLSNGGGYGVYLTGNEAVLTLHKPAQTNSDAMHSKGGQLRHQQEYSVLRMRLVNAISYPIVSGVDELPGKSNYFVGNDQNKWITNVPHYARVRYAGVYPGVDLEFHGSSERQLEYDFVVAPGADPHQIALDVQGAASMTVDQGDLVLRVAAGQIRLQKPVVYQEINNKRKEIVGRYSIKSEHQIGFEIGQYDRSQPVVIDPVLVYSTFFGGGGPTEARGIAVDVKGNAYITGTTHSPDFPQANPVQPCAVDQYGVCSLFYSVFPSAFVTKISADGSQLIYSSYLGGPLTEGTSIAVDLHGNAYVTGSTFDRNFPTTPNALQPSIAGLPVTPDGYPFDAFVTKLSSSGSALVYSTYLGGSWDDSASGIAVDFRGNAYIVGWTASVDFPTVNPLEAGHASIYHNTDAFLAKLNRTGSTLVYSTYLGGSGQDNAGGVAVDLLGNAYVTGGTCSTDFPLVSALQPVMAVSCDNFLSKINAPGTQFAYSTYLSGGGAGVAVDILGNAYVTGPASLVTKMNRAGSALVYSINGSGVGIAVDPIGRACVTDGSVVTKVNASGSTLLYSVPLNGSGTIMVSTGLAVDLRGSAYVTGYAYTPPSSSVSAETFVIKIR